jgi:hypothetical protein
VSAFGQVYARRANRHNVGSTRPARRAFDEQCRHVGCYAFLGPTEENDPLRDVGAGAQ